MHSNSIASVELLRQQILECEATLQDLRQQLAEAELALRQQNKTQDETKPSHKAPLAYALDSSTSDGTETDEHASKKAKSPNSRTA